MTRRQIIDYKVNKNIANKWKWHQEWEKDNLEVQALINFKKKINNKKIVSKIINKKYISYIKLIIFSRANK